MLKLTKKKSKVKYKNDRIKELDTHNANKNTGDIHKGINEFK